jgi:hypothetical protein
MDFDVDQVTVREMWSNEFQDMRATSIAAFSDPSMGRCSML